MRTLVVCETVVEFWKVVGFSVYHPCTQTESDELLGLPKCRCCAKRRSVPKGFRAFLVQASTEFHRLALRPTLRCQVGYGSFLDVHAALGVFRDRPTVDSAAVARQRMGLCRLLLETLKDTGVRKPSLESPKGRLSASRSPLDSWGSCGEHGVVFSAKLSIDPKFSFLASRSSCACIPNVVQLLSVAQ